MSDHHSEIDAAIKEVESARKVIAKAQSVQIRNAEQRDFLKATALSWFRSRRPVVASAMSPDLVEAIDRPYRVVLDSSDHAAARNTYRDALNTAKAALLVARGAVLAAPVASATSDAAPDFTPLAADIDMRRILAARWDECQRCISASAPLAATVMMGGLLEALFVARANKMTDKPRLFRCTSTPVDHKTKKPLDLRSWTLASYIDVGHELDWISRSAKDVAVVLRDYRNYVHPEKERSHGVKLAVADATMFWELTKSLSRQLLSMTGVL